MKKKVLIFSWFYLPFLGGAELFIKAVTDRLSDRFDFTLVTGRMKSELPGEERQAEVEIRRVGLGMAIDKALYPVAAVSRALRLGSFDLVHAVMASGGALAAAGYLKLRPRPSLLTLQEGDAEDYVRSYLGPLFAIYPWLHRRFDRVHAISRFLAERAVGYGARPESVTVVPNGVEPSLLVPGPGPEEKLSKLRALDLEGKQIVVAVARFSPEKGLDRLIRAMPLVKRQVPDSALLLVGDGRERPRLERLAEELGVRDRIRFAGSVPPPEVKHHLGLASVFALPSRVEGLGSSFLEAMACGLPIVAGPVGGIPDFLEDGKTGLFCEPENPASLSEKIVRLLRDDALASRLGRAGWQLVRERYQWDAASERIAEIYRELISARE